MSKRDTIIVAVLINIGLLAILFMVATTNTSDDPISEQAEMKYTFEESTTPSAQVQQKNSDYATYQNAPRDEVDEVLHLNSVASNSTSSTLPPTEVALPPKSYQETPVQKVTTPVVAAPSASTANYSEVAVKKGDALEKIARANGTSVEEIKKINNLVNERLDIGQILKIPANKTSKNVVAAVTPPKIAQNAVAPSAPAPVAASSEPLYHTIKSGDNPWKIARQYKVKYEDILRLNNMTEEKARNLKIGDKIRVK